jgi:hypothetical protein
LSLNVSFDRSHPAVFFNIDKAFLFSHNTTSATTFYWLYCWCLRCDWIKILYQSQRQVSSPQPCIYSSNTHTCYTPSPYHVTQNSHTIANNQDCNELFSSRQTSKVRSYDAAKKIFTRYFTAFFVRRYSVHNSERRCKTGSEIIILL